MLNFTGKTANFEEWYEAIEPFTPKSTYFKVDHETKKVIVGRTYDQLWKLIPYFGETNRRVSTKGIDEFSKITSLVDLMEKHIQRKDVFFRTNLFSPKDVKNPCFVSNGLEAWETLISSERLHRGYQELLKDDDLYLVFREKVEYKEEFRCFIENGHVKGISQYDDSNSIRRGKGASRIFTFDEREYLNLLDFVQHVVQSAGIMSCVLDVGYTPTGISVIELNPFGSVTDKSLFANTDIYSELTTGSTEIRYWKDHQTLSILESKNGRIVSRKEDWLPTPKRQGASLNFANLQAKLLDLKLNV